MRLVFYSGPEPWRWGILDKVYGTLIREPLEVFMNNPGYNIDGSRKRRTYREVDAQSHGPPHAEAAEPPKGR